MDEDPIYRTRTEWGVAWPDGDFDNYGSDERNARGVYAEALAFSAEGDDEYDGAILQCRTVTVHCSEWIDAPTEADASQRRSVPGETTPEGKR